MFDATTPDNSAIMLSGSSLRPSDIRVRFGGRRPRPLLFINACHGARTGFTFTGLGGWAERLVEARVGAFVGAMWEVNDGLALRFAQRFYTGLLKDNLKIAEAFRQAREEIRQLAPYNSTWLAYALYADPEGRFKDSPQDKQLASEICKTDSSGVTLSSALATLFDQNNTERRNAQNKKKIRI
ncbi:MAG: CHAT domain-containing protein [Scytonema sp. CRU_2_7]|nr:CHAT domain-containing protein [Scytonema sp. CRU_2_7]